MSKTNLSSGYASTDEELKKPLNSDEEAEQDCRERVPPSFVTKLKRLMGFRIIDTQWRCIPVGEPSWPHLKEFPSNSINNRRYSLITFLPLALFNQFKLFFNVFFLAVAVSQFVPALQVGFLFIYFAPLAFVVSLSLIKDAWDDFCRYRRDRAANLEKYEVLRFHNGSTTTEKITAEKIVVGDVLILHPKYRIPADCILLHTNESSGASFVRTDQLDGETDWKLRFPLKATCALTPDRYGELQHLELVCEPPHKDIYSFSGAASNPVNRSLAEGVGMENTLWANCVVASGTVLGAVIYTGTDTRSAMNANKPSTKRGLVDIELNFISALCFLLLVLLSLLLVVQQQFQGRWYIMIVRFIILLSSIIPISMRVNIDVARMWYSLVVFRDTKIPGTVVRNTNIPEELGRLQFLFSDKTGTLTKNIMEFRTLQLGPQFTLQHDNEDDFTQALNVYFSSPEFQPGGVSGHEGGVSAASALSQRHSVGSAPSKIIGFSQQQVKEIGNAVLALSLCHNVTPVTSEEDGGIEFQASSPDEVAMVKFSATINVHLHERTLKKIDLKVPSITADGGASSGGSSRSSAHPTTKHVESTSAISVDNDERHSAASGHSQTYTGADASMNTVSFHVVKMFPFTSERKSMSIILKEENTGHYWFYMKGADVKMKDVITRSEWLEESCLEMAEKGLRTLVFARKQMTEEQVNTFMHSYERANAILGDKRADAVEEVMVGLELGLELVCITGVEDQLQDDVTSSLETLGMCGVKVWMLTGDKVETATCIGRSTQLIPRQSEIFSLLARTVEEAEAGLQECEKRFHPQHSGYFIKQKWTLIIDGGCLAMCLQPELEEMFANIARMAHSVIVARCSPTQKAAVVQCIRKYSPENVRSAAIGDGGNDVSMILAANVGIGVEGLEGKQASMAADFSITKFSHCLRLIMWHGRNSYIRTCRLSQFIIHRGIVYSVVQTVFSLLFDGSTMSVFNGYLLMGYATAFTMAPVFALVLDEDHFEKDINEFPQLYKELLKSRQMNTRSFLQWVWISFFQGGVMMYLALELFSEELFQIVSIAFTSLLITELVIVAAGVHFRVLWEQRRLHLWLFLASEMVSLAFFFSAVFLLPDTFDRRFFFSSQFWLKTVIICAASIGPIFVLWLVGKYILFRKHALQIF